MVPISRAWNNGPSTMAAKPIKSLELHCTMIQFLIIRVTALLALQVVDFAFSFLHILLQPVKFNIPSKESN